MIDPIGDPPRDDPARLPARISHFLEILGKIRNAQDEEVQGAGLESISPG